MSHLDTFTFTEGYYSLPSILLSLSFCTLLRVESIEKISDLAPGELGKLIGLDRIPEIKTLRNKIMVLSQDNQPQEWLNKLSKEWMQNFPDLAGVLYIDGHEEVYFGKHNQLPRRYVSRLRLAMRATTDYWVCDKLGQPFFSINKDVSGSMIEVIKDEIVPRLLQDVPHQPTEEMLEEDHFLHRFMIVYDREGYSNDFMIDMWEKRIACCTYNKYVDDLWSEDEFREYEIEDEYGKKEKVKLAERCIFIEGKESEKLEESQLVYKINDVEEGEKYQVTNKRTKKKKQQWAREVRKLSENGHQTSIITTNYKLNLMLIGIYMFARWCQENFFKYMVKNYGLDMLISNFMKTIDDTVMVVNPQWRAVDKQFRSINTKLKNLESKFGSLNYEHKLEERPIKEFNDKKAKLQEGITIYRSQRDELKQKRKDVPYKIQFLELPDDEKFKGVYNERKQFVDTTKLICYRAETALSATAKKYMAKPKESRALLVQLFNSSADIKADTEKDTLRIIIHNQSTRKEDKIVEALCNELNETETIFPGTNLKMVYSLNE